MSDAAIDLASTFGWRLCDHARTKARARAVTVREILKTVAAPEVTYTAFSYGPGRYVYQRGQLGVVGLLRREVT